MQKGADFVLLIATEDRKGIVAAVANSIVKGIFAVSLGSAVLRRQVAVVLGLTILVGSGWLWMSR